MCCTMQRLRDQKVRGAAIIGEQHGELEADLSISDLRRARSCLKDFRNLLWFQHWQMMLSSPSEYVHQNTCHLSTTQSRTRH